MRFSHPYTLSGLVSQIFELGTIYGAADGSQTCRPLLSHAFSSDIAHRRVGELQAFIYTNQIIGDNLPEKTESGFPTAFQLTTNMVAMLSTLDC